MINPEAISPDAELERRIAFQAGLIAISITPAEQMAAWEEFKRLHAMRSPERVDELEREQRLR